MIFRITYPGAAVGGGERGEMIFVDLEEEKWKIVHQNQKANKLYHYILIILSFTKHFFISPERNIY